MTDPSAVASGRLINGTFSLVSPLELRTGSSAFAPLGTGPLTLQAYTGPVSNHQATIGLRQAIAANEPLRTGAYTKALTFTLSTTQP